MTKNKTLGRRLIIYLFGFFIMTMGISLSAKSNLGVSLVSSIPYTITCVFGIEMGNATILYTNHSNTEEIYANRNVLIVKFTAIWYDYRQLFMKIYRKISLSEVKSEWSATINKESLAI